MRVTKLPSYSTERYYLLSEIEQRVSLLFLDEVGSNEIPFHEAIIVFGYLLWNISEESTLEHIKSKIQSLIEKLKLDDAKQSPIVLILVETVTIECKDVENNDMMIDLIKWVKEIRKATNIAIIIGLSNKSGAAPSLEVCYDFTEGFVAQCLSRFLDNDTSFRDRLQQRIQPMVLLVAMNRQDCLGHDPTREPDAESDIMQWQCYDDDFKVTDCISQTIERFTSPLEEVCRSVQPSPNHSTTHRIPVIVLLPILISLLIYYLWCTPS